MLDKGKLPIANITPIVGMPVAQNIFVTEYGAVRVNSRFHSADGALIVVDILLSTLTKV